MKNFLFKSFWLGSAVFITFTSNIVTCQITEGFENITTLPASGWVIQNNSVPLGQLSWFQGNPTAFPSYNGALESYIGANYNSVNLIGTISNWLITPNVTLKNGDVFSFFTRTSIDNQWADRLQVRMSTNGASANVGFSESSVGDFTQLLLEINPNLQLSVYPMVWTQYNITISGLAAPTSGRLAFRYFVTNGGINGTSSDYIGIDNFVYTPYVCPTISVTPSLLNQAFAGLPFSQDFSQSGSQSNVTYSVSSGSLPQGLVLQSSGVLSGTPSQIGPFSFTVTATDASGCIGSQAYTMQVLCNPNGASLNNLPVLCSNGSNLILNQGLPSGGTYTGIGVNGNQFSPSAGSQLITYTVNDTYGCLQTASSTILVNDAPQVELSSFTNQCFNAPPIVLTGGSPIGGTYSGISVSGGIFTPNAVGDFPITYSYIDANGCSGSATQSIRVENCAGIDALELNQIQIFPNPNNGHFFLIIDQELSGATCLIRNLTGQVVDNPEIMYVEIGSNSFISLDCKYLNTGVYFLELTGSKKKLYGKVIIEK